MLFEDFKAMKVEERASLSLKVHNTILHCNRYSLGEIEAVKKSGRVLDNHFLICFDSLSYHTK